MSVKISTQIPEYPGTIWRDLIPPEEHPGFKYVGFQPGKIVTLPKGHVLEPGYGAFRLDVVMELDVAVAMRDGIRIYTNVFRPAEPEPAKLPALIAWSPYGKGSGGIGPQNYDSMGPFRMGVDYQRLSGYETFEGPNPAEWCERGYVVVNPDARGSGHSEGNIVWWGMQEAADLYDLIEWCTQQNWCDGNVVMFGNSWLAICQINHASRCPHPALKAIAPWEALNDPYYDINCRGGVVNGDAFGDIIMGGFAGMAKAEDIFAIADQHPLYDDYWETKHIDVEKLDIPMYLTASYSSRIHSWGSFTTFAKAKSKDKWLRVHDTQEWNDIYKKEAMDDLQKFYDYFGKGKQDNGWKSTPPLRLSLLAMHGSTVSSITERPEQDSTFPLSRTKYQKLYLDSNSMSLATSLPAHEHKTSYEAHSLTDQVVFTVKFEKYTELSGFPWIKLFMSCHEKDDMDVNVMIRKIDRFGNMLEHANYSMPVPVHKIPGSNVAKFQGVNGLLRASHRITKQPKSHPDEVPGYTHRSRESVAPGTVVNLEIPIWPIGMVFDEGEGVAVVIAGHDLKLPEILLGERKEPSDQNVGRHIVHTGGGNDSFVMLPVIA